MAAYGAIKYGRTIFYVRKNILESFIIIYHDNGNITKYISTS